MKIFSEMSEINSRSAILNLSEHFLRVYFIFFLYINIYAAVTPQIIGVLFHVLSTPNKLVLNSSFNLQCIDKFI